MWHVQMLGGAHLEPVVALERGAGASTRPWMRARGVSTAPARQNRKKGQQHVRHTCTGCAPAASRPRLRARNRRKAHDHITHASRQGERGGHIVSWQSWLTQGHRLRVAVANAQ